MSERGVFGVDRGVWDHPVLRGRAPFRRVEAFLWLVSEAAWKPRRLRVGGQTITLARGQLAHSIRYMAKAWRWEKTKVERFFDDLKTETMIATDTATGITITTICNYDKYQVVGLPNETENAPEHATQTRQQRDSSATNTKKENIKEGKKEVESARATRIPDDFSLSDDLIAFSAEHGFAGDPLQSVFADFCDYWRSRDGPLARKRDWAATWRRWIRQEANKPQGRNNGKPTLRSTANALADHLRTLGDNPARELRSGAGGADVRLLPARTGERPGNLHDGDSGGAGGIPSRGDHGGDRSEVGDGAKGEVVAFRR